jgi:hypothetical protein
VSMFKRLFGKQQEFTHDSPNPARAAAGAERAKFLEAAAVVLARPAGEIDAAKTLQGDYGCDPFDISECAQLAEEIWRVKILPNPMTGDDINDLPTRFPTLDTIISTAERLQHKG